MPGSPPEHVDLPDMYKGIVCVWAADICICVGDVMAVTSVTRFLLNAGYATLKKQSSALSKCFKPQHQEWSF